MHKLQGQLIVIIMLTCMFLDCARKPVESLHIKKTCKVHKKGSILNWYHQPSSCEAAAPTTCGKKHKHFKLLRCSLSNDDII